MTGSNGDKMIERTLGQALALLRLREPSLMESYGLALDVAKITHGNDDALLRLQAITQELITLIEREGADKAFRGLEPAYHNRKHIADAILSMGYFLSYAPNLDIYEKQLLLLVMLVHDFGHRGMANKLPELSHEDESIALLKATPLKGLPPEDIFFIEECISGTKYENINKVSEDCLNNPLDSFSFMRALVNDADIAASFVGALDEELSKLILLEKGIANPNEKEIQDTLSAFKHYAQITTPIARKLLGIKLSS